jgi:hypothetical protein
MSETHGGKALPVRSFQNHKTRLQWFNNLPEDVRQKALANFQNHYPDEEMQQRLLHREESNLEDCIKGSFTFNQAKEGADYWEEVINLNK